MSAFVLATKATTSSYSAWGTLNAFNVASACLRKIVQSLSLMLIPLWESFHVTALVVHRAAGTGAEKIHEELPFPLLCRPRRDAARTGPVAGLFAGGPPDRC